MTIDALILKTLRSASGNFVSGAELANRLKISRAAIWGHIEELRELGYDIEASPHLGYRLKNSPDILLGDDLSSRLTDAKIIGREIHVFHETTSTNDIIEKMAIDGVFEGVVVFAESQTKGRGRLGRIWHSSARKGLWFSVLLRPVLHPRASMQITIAAATAIRNAIYNLTHLPALIKWPNDVVVNGKKIAGILNEISAETDRIKHSILGIGINVNHDVGDFPHDVRKIATSVKIEKGATVNRAELAVAALEELDKYYQKILNKDFQKIADEWTHYCETIGKNVTIRLPDRVAQGRAEALDADGCLLLRKAHGHLERIVGGDVTVEK